MAARPHVVLAGLGIGLSVLQAGGLACAADRPPVASSAPPTPLLATHCRIGTPMPAPRPALVWHPEPSDEFDGPTLDHTRWHDRNPGWSGRPPGRFDPSQVDVRDGHLILSTTEAPAPAGQPRRFLHGTVVSRRLFLHGYYEIRAQAAPAAVTSSFWFYRDTPSTWTEIDVFENTGHPGFSRHSRSNLHIFRLPGLPAVSTEDGVQTALHDDVSRTWITYGLHWTPQRLDFYLDGCRVRSTANTLWHQPLNAVLDMEVMVDWLGLPAAPTLPARFRIDYFRVWT